MTVASPSTMRLSQPVVSETFQWAMARPFARRLATLTDVVSTNVVKTPSIQLAATGTAWGRPSGRVVAQNTVEPKRFDCAWTAARSGSFVVAVFGDGISPWCPLSGNGNIRPCRVGVLFAREMTNRSAPDRLIVSCRMTRFESRWQSA